MQIAHDEKHRIAQIISFFLSGEKIAHRCAARQAKLSNDPLTRRFLLTQSRQEKFHASVFQSAIMWLRPKGVHCPAQKQMQQYEDLLNSSIDNNDLLASTLGMQVIFEAMGDVALSHFNHGINKRNIGYSKIRQTILAQEDAHLEFGLNYTEANKTAAINSKYTEDYLTLINDIFISLDSYFEIFDEDSHLYHSEFQRNLPSWMQHETLNNYPNN